jgi:hypothetical protein
LNLSNFIFRLSRMSPGGAAGCSRG